MSGALHQHEAGQRLPRLQRPAVQGAPGLGEAARMVRNGRTPEADLFPIGESAPESAARLSRCTPGRQSGLGQILPFKKQFEGEQTIGAGIRAPAFNEIQRLP